jgi:hypothetical protein
MRLLSADEIVSTRSDELRHEQNNTGKQTRINKPTR